MIGDVLPPMRYVWHGFQMIAAYVGQMAPAGRITLVALFQAADEMRRVHRIAHRMGQLRQSQLSFGVAAMEQWQELAAWQPLRRVLEEALVAYDWGEAFTALCLCIKPLIDDLLLGQFAGISRQRGDFFLGEILASFAEDARWHRTWAGALVTLLLDGPEDVAQGNRAALTTWLARWLPGAQAAVRATAGLLGPDGPAAAARSEQASLSWLKTLHSGAGVNQAGSLNLALAERLLARSSDGMVAFDRRFHCVFWNALMERLTGLKADDVIGQDLLALFPYLTETGENQLLQRAVNGEEVSSSNRLYWIPGTNRRGFFDGSYGPLRDQTGQITGGIGIIRDVTAQLRATELLQETEGRFRNMADVAPVLLWMSDPDGLCTFFNQTWLTFTGRTQEQEWGVGWAEGVHFEDFQRCMDTYVENFNQRRLFEMEYRLRRRDGEYRWLLDRGTPRYLPDGTFAGYIGSCIDITERRQLEVQLRQAVQARDEFLSVASHELKTPLTSLQLQIETLGRHLERRPQEALQEGRLQTGAKTVSDQARRLANLIEMLLDVSRINAGRLRFAYSDLDFMQVLRESVNRWQPLAAEVESELTLEGGGIGVGASGALPDSLPGTCDRARLDQILNNLLSNAVKYGPGKPIRLLLQADDNLIRFAVSDGGIGIPESDQPRIFKRFERAVSSRNYAGLGLGLWITHELVIALGGKIGVTSQPAHGSIFSVELPRQRGSRSAD